MPTITTKIESARGCGYRKKGGLYLVTDGRGSPCGKLPIELTVCPCCGSGVKFSRGYTWVTGELLADSPCTLQEFRDCGSCVFSNLSPIKRFGLLWVGEMFYTPEQFTLEAMAKGISKRIATVPNGFVVGKTWILLAHIKAVKKVVGMDPEPVFVPGIFYAFCPQRIEYIVTGLETDEQLEAMEKRGITLINVIRDIDTQTKLFTQNTEQ